MPTNSPYEVRQRGGGGVGAGDDVGEGVVADLGKGEGVFVLGFVELAEEGGFVLGRVVVALEGLGGVLEHALGGGGGVLEDGDGEVAGEVDGEGEGGAHGADPAGAFEVGCVLVFLDGKSVYRREVGV